METDQNTQRGTKEGFTDSEMSGPVDIRNRLFSARPPRCRRQLVSGACESLLRQTPRILLTAYEDWLVWGLMLRVLKSVSSHIPQYDIAAEKPRWRGGEPPVPGDSQELVQALALCQQLSREGGGHVEAFELRER